MRKPTRPSSPHAATTRTRPARRRPATTPGSSWTSARCTTSSQLRSSSFGTEGARRLRLRLSLHRPRRPLLVARRLFHRPRLRHPRLAPLRPRPAPVVSSAARAAGSTMWSTPTTGSAKTGCLDRCRQTAFQEPTSPTASRGARPTSLLTFPIASGPERLWTLRFRPRPHLRHQRRHRLLLPQLRPPRSRKTTADSAQGRTSGSFHSSP